MCRVARELPPPIKINPNAGAFPTGVNNAPSVQPSSKMDVAVKVSNTRVETKSALVNRQCQVFELGPVIHEGKIGNTHLATVLKATNMPSEYERDGTAEPHSVKIYSLPELKKSSQKFISNPWQEIDLYQLLDNYYSPNNNLGSGEVPPGAHIVKLKEVCIVNQTIHMIFPHYKDGNLTSLLESKYAGGAMPLEEVQKVVRHISSALCHLHEVGIVHNHVSLDNIYYSATEDKYFLHDLSMSIRVPSNQQVFSATFGTGCAASLPCGQEGCFIPPEVWTATDAASSEHLALVEEFAPEMLFARDVWALGIIAYTLLTGVAPMERAMESDAYYQLICQEERLVELYRQMLTAAGCDEGSVESNTGNSTGNQEDLYGVEGIEEEIYDDEERQVLEGMELVQRMLLCSPKKRIVAKEVLIHQWIQTNTITNNTNSNTNTNSCSSMKDSLDGEEVDCMEVVRREEKFSLDNHTDNDRDSNHTDSEGVEGDPSLVRVHSAKASKHSFEADSSSSSSEPCKKRRIVEYCM